MKKVLSIILTLALVLSFAFAQGATDDGVYSGVTDNAYRPGNSAYYDGLNYSIFRNPSDLANPRLRVQGLDIDTLSFNYAKALQNRSVAESLSNITKFDWDKKNWINYIMGLFTEVGSGYNSIVAGGFGTGAQIGNFGFGVNANVEVKSMPRIKEDGTLDTDKKSILGNGYLPVLDAAITFGYGMRIIEQDVYSLDVGASVHIAEKIYMLQINYDKVSDLINKTASFDSLPSRGGLGFPIDVSPTLGFFGQRLNVSLMANNLNGYYSMKWYENFKKAASFDGGERAYTLYTPWSLSASVIYNPRLGAVNPTVGLEITCLNLYLQNDYNKARPFMELLKYVHLSATVDLFGIGSVKASYKYGYPELGIGAGFLGSKMELVYGYREAGKDYGDKPVDYMSFRVRLAYDK